MTDLQASQPFARYEDDRERDEYLKEQLRSGDPMAHLVKKRGGSRWEAAAITERYDVDELQKSGGFFWGGRECGRGRGVFSWRGELASADL